MHIVTQSQMATRGVVTSGAITQKESIANLGQTVPREREHAFTIRPTHRHTMSQMTTTMSVSRRIAVTHAAASRSKCQPDSVNDPSRFGPTFAPVQNVRLIR
jgi:hypothetical protein